MKISNNNNDNIEILPFVVAENHYLRYFKTPQVAYKKGRFFFWDGDIKNPDFPPSKSVHITDCRDSFYIYTKSSYKGYPYYGNNIIKHVGFCCDVNVDTLAERVKDFFNTIESQLKIKELTVVYKTPRNDVILLTVSPWWSENFTRMSLFSLFLRMGAVDYLEKDLEKALETSYWGKRTSTAIKYFLEGNTIPTFNEDSNHWATKMSIYSNISCKNGIFLNDYVPHIIPVLKGLLITPEEHEKRTKSL
jgi:hypothetical protein